MRPINQAIVEKVLAVTDAIGIHREVVRIPLAMQGEGSVKLGKDGRIEVALPDTADLGPFLEALPERIRATGFAQEE